jgi:hypothetical protein
VAYEPKKDSEMAAKKHKAEKIVMKLRQIDVLNAQGKSMAKAIRSMGVTEVTYYRWRAEYGGLKGRQGEALEGAGDRECSAPAGCFRSDSGQNNPCGGRQGKPLSPARRRACVDHVTAELSVSERRASQVLGQHRSR